MCSGALKKLAKLRVYGISGQILNWFKNYLSGWVQRVVVDGAASQWAPVTSGVRQGSLPGPLLFTTFIDNLPNESKRMVTIALYAEDTKIFNCIGSEEDCLVSQATLSNMEHWRKVKNICFNASKCKALSVTIGKKLLCCSYNFDDVHLTRVTEEKDLGVTFTCFLLGQPHP